MDDATKCSLGEEVEVGVHVYADHSRMILGMNSNDLRHQSSAHIGLETAKNLRAMLDKAIASIEAKLEEAKRAEPVAAPR